MVFLHFAISFSTATDDLRTDLQHFLAFINNFWDDAFLSISFITSCRLYAPGMAFLNTAKPLENHQCLSYVLD